MKVKEVRDRLQTAHADNTLQMLTCSSSVAAAACPLPTGRVGPVGTRGTGPQHLQAGRSPENRGSTPFSSSLFSFPPALTAFQAPLLFTVLTRTEKMLQIHTHKTEGEREWLRRVKEFSAERTAEPRTLSQLSVDPEP